MTKEEGIKAIIALQEFTGIIETEADASVGWDAMTDDEKVKFLSLLKDIVRGYSLIGKT